MGAKENAGRMGIGEHEKDWFCDDCVAAWGGSPPQAKDVVAKAVMPTDGLELVLKLRFPSGDLEPILVGPFNDGITVLTKMLPLKKTYIFPEDMQIMKPDGQELQLGQAIRAQGLHDGSILSVQGRA